MLDKVKKLQCTTCNKDLHSKNEHGALQYYCEEWFKDEFHEHTYIELEKNIITVCYMKINELAVHYDYNTLHLIHKLKKNNNKRKLVKSKIYTYENFIMEDLTKDYYLSLINNYVFK